MRKFFIPELHQIFQAPLLCPNCLDETKHVIQLTSIKLEDEEYKMNCKVACTVCDCETTTNKDGKEEYKIRHIDEAKLTVEDWKELIERLNE